MPRADLAGGETLTHRRLPRKNRSHAEDGLQDVRGMSALQRPERSGDLGPMGRLTRNNRSHAEDGASEVRGTSCREPTEPEARP